MRDRTDQQSIVENSYDPGNKEAFDLDNSLYSPSIDKESQLDPTRKVYDPSTFFFFAFFLSLFMMFPVLYNYYQFRKWTKIFTSFLLFSVSVTAAILITLYLHEVYNFDTRDTSKFTFRVPLMLLGVWFYIDQKKEYRWFQMADGVTRSALITGLIIFITGIIFPMVYGIVAAPYVIIAQIIFNVLK